jgi:hypothetical protein
MTKYALCDLPNTMFDSRHRTEPFGLYTTGINKDTLNYQCKKVIDLLKKQGYFIIYTHYMLTRLEDLVKKNVIKYNLMDDKSKLYTNFATQEVHSNATLKMYLYTQFLQQEQLDWVIDNSNETLSFWLNQNIQPIQIPLLPY